MVAHKGHIKAGGRQKGTPNKTTTDLKEWVNDILTNGKERFIENMQELEPQEYIKMFTGLLNYVIPKQQSMSIDAQIESEYKHLELLLDTTPNEYIEKIAGKILELQEKKE